MPVKPVHSWHPVRKTDLTGGISNHVADVTEMRKLVADVVVQQRGFWRLDRPGDLVKQVQGVRFHR